MTRTEIERLTVIETKFDTVIEPMALKVDQIYDSFKEVKRKVDRHHEKFQEHCEIVERYKPPVKRESDGNGGYKERRAKKSWRQQFKDTPVIKRWGFAIIAIPFAGAYWEWGFGKIHQFLNWLEALPK